MRVMKMMVQSNQIRKEAQKWKRKMGYLQFMYHTWCDISAVQLKAACIPTVRGTGNAFGGIEHGYSAWPEGSEVVCMDATLSRVWSLLHPIFRITCTPFPSGWYFDSRIHTIANFGFDLNFVFSINDGCLIKWCITGNNKTRGRLLQNVTPNNNYDRPAFLLCTFFMIWCSPMMKWSTKSPNHQSKTRGVENSERFNGRYCCSST